MRLLRILVVALIAGSLAVAFLVDEGDRPARVRIAAGQSAGAASSADAGVWFCPGGSAPGGVAEVGIELVNVGETSATAVIVGIRSGAGPEAREQTEIIEPGERRLVRLTDLVTDSPWMGAIVEVESGRVVVEQTATGDNTDTDRAACHSATSDLWVLASGATRVAEFGETNTILVLNPFLEDAVLDVRFDADVGVDSLTGVVAPARRVIAIDVTEAVTVAGRVSAVIDVVAGRVAVTRIQTVSNDEQVGLSVTPGSPELAPVWFLPNVNRANRNDVITVVNPSPTDEAKVDLEIVADGGIDFDPIELTLRPGRTAVVRLAAESRLEGVESMSIIARSLDGVPVAVMNESYLGFGDGPVSNLSATVGTAIMATEWVAPIEQDEGGLVLFNPADGIVTASVSEFVDGELVPVADVELGAGRRAILEATAFSTDRPLVTVEAPTPIVVGREQRGVSLHAQLLAVPAAGAEPLS